MNTSLPADYDGPIPGLDSAIPSDGTAALMSTAAFTPKPTRVSEQRRLIPAGSFAEINQPANFVVVKEADGPLNIALDGEADWEAAPGLKYEAPEDRQWTRLTVKNPSTTATLAVVLLVGIGSASLSRPAGKGFVQGNVTTQNTVPNGVATVGSAVEIPVFDGEGTLSIQVTGTYTGALSLQGTIDGLRWETFGGTPLLSVNTGAATATIAGAAVGIYQADVSAFRRVRVTGLAAMTGTAVVTLCASPTCAMVGLDSPLLAGSAKIGDVGFQVTASATGAASRSHLVAAATTNPTIVKASAGRLLGWSIFNASAAVRFVKLHNQATAPTAGTGVVQTIAIPAGASVNFHSTVGIAFTTGIALTTVTGAADADATAVAAADLVVDLFYA